MIGLAGPLLAGRTVVRDGYRGLEDPTHQQFTDVRDQGFAVNDGQECGVSTPLPAWPTSRNLTHLPMPAPTRAVGPGTNRFGEALVLRRAVRYCSQHSN